jgi:cysteinyl-tRNA synthetase
MRRLSMRWALAARYKPRPTVYMPQIIKYVDDLVEKGAAYVVDGDVYLRSANPELWRAFRATASRISNPAPGSM